MRRKWTNEYVQYCYNNYFGHVISDATPDLTEYLQDEIKGPAKFSCTGGMSNCKFEEDAMNEMIDSIFADPYITLTCGGGECLHYSQVPGYIVSSSPALMLSLVDSSSFIFKLGA